MSDELSHYRLSPRANEDLDEIWRYTAEKWSIAQADHYINDLVRTFDMLVAMPTLARERREFVPSVRIHVHNNHLIVYVVADDHIVVLRLLGGHQDWRRILDLLDA